MAAQDGYTYDLCIVGAGPAGVEAALQARALGISHIVIEKNDIGSLLANTMADKRFYHEYGSNTDLPLGLIPFPDRIMGSELVNLWKDALAACTVAEPAGVVAIRSVGQEGFVVEADGGAPYLARRVLLSSGTHEHPRELGIPGEWGNPSVRYGLDYRDIATGKDVLIVGGGNSALETAIHYAFGNDVTLIIRKSDYADSVTPGNREEISELAKNGEIAVRFDSEVERIEGNTATIRSGAERSSAPFDILFVHIGYRQPIEFLRALDIDTSESGMPILSSNFESSRKGLFVAGALTGADSVIESANQAYRIVRKIADEIREGEASVV